MVKDDEGHGFVNPDNVIDMYQAVERFLGRAPGWQDAILQRTPIAGFSRRSCRG